MAGIAKVYVGNLGGRLNDFKTLKNKTQTLREREREMRRDAVRKVNPSRDACICPLSSMVYVDLFYSRHVCFYNKLPQVS